VLSVLAVGAAIILKSQPGRAFRAIREDHLAASGAGIRVNRALNLSFVLSATYASVAGSLYAHTIAFVDPTAFTLDLSVSTIAMLVIGGSGSVVGAIIGAAILQYATQYLRSYQAYSQVLYGLVILFGALVSPVGIVGGFRLIVARVPALRKVFLPAPVARPPIDVRAKAAAERSPNRQRLDGAIGTSGEVPSTVHLEALDIRKSFGGVKALQGVSVVVEAGKIHALIGPNGSGKSTFINCLSGILKADTGTVTIGTKRIDRMAVSARSRSGLARTYQNGRLFRSLPVHENVTIAADHRNEIPGVLGRHYPGVTGSDWVELIIDLVGITHLETSMAVTLGFGNQRRVELARALALDPSFLLLDEPAAGLSSTEKGELIALLNVFRGLGMGILLVEHSMDVVMGIADTITVLDFGQVIGHGTVDEVRNDRKVLDAYLGVA
jgi:branched-chain amino acid transport system permease protein